MGLSPEQVLDLPLYDYQAAVYHYLRSQSSDDDAETLTDEEFDEMLVGLAGHESQAMH